VVIIGVFRRLQLSSILGYLVVGILLGPHSLGMLTNTEHIQLLAELGVVFLMFTVGLEFSSL
jgi:CPA2 family monovalent cation:H+ antiporter-2